VLPVNSLPSRPVGRAGPGHRGAHARPATPPEAPTPGQRRAGSLAARGHGGPATHTRKAARRRARKTGKLESCGPAGRGLRQVSRFQVLSPTAVGTADPMVRPVSSSSPRMPSALPDGLAELQVSTRQSPGASSVRAETLAEEDSALAQDDDPDSDLWHAMFQGWLPMPNAALRQTCAVIACEQFTRVHRDRFVGFLLSAGSAPLRRNGSRTSSNPRRCGRNDRNIPGFSRRSH
jgi:hypothetical protein